MASAKREKVSEVASQLDELQTTVDELEDDPPKTIKSKTVGELKKAVHLAAAVSAKLEDQDEQHDS